MKPDVFISYSHVNRDIAHRLLKRLERIGVQCFMDEKDIKWGTPLTQAVRTALDHCCGVVVIISNASLKSSWVPFEVGHAMGANSMGANKKILPLVTDQTLDLPGYIAGLSYVTEVSDAVTYFKSQSWKEHCHECREAQSSDVVGLRKEIATLNSFLRKYMPSTSEPEDL